MVSGIDISYKTVERLYIELVMMALHNLHVLLLKKKGITQSDATGAGYSLTVKKNYESYAQKLKDMAKVSVDKGQETKKHALRIHVCHNGPEDKDVHSIWYKQA